MGQYIPKSVVLDELKRRRDAALERQKNLEAIGQESVINEMVANALNRIISSINNLEVKEVDLEKEHLWKPSEEMLEALYRVIPENVMEISEDEMLLDKLYQGLKYGKVLSEK